VSLAKIENAMIFASEGVVNMTIIQKDGENNGLLVRPEVLLPHEQAFPAV